MPEFRDHSLTPWGARSDNVPASRIAIGDAKDEDSRPTPSSCLTIIVTTYDLSRKRYLRTLIDSLALQKSKNFEVVVVVERHPELCEAIREYLRLKGLNSKVVVNDGKRGISASRNVGIGLSSQDVVSIVDDDVFLYETWVSSVLALFENKEVIAATGPVLPLWEDASMSWFPGEFHWLVGCSSWSNRNHIMETRNVWGANMAFRRSELLRVGGFSTKIGGIYGRRLHGEENELSLRLKGGGGTIVFSPDMKVGHFVSRRRLNIRQVMKSSFDMGRTRVLYMGNRSLMSDEVGVVSRILRRGLCSLFQMPVKPKQASYVIFLSMVVISLGALGFLNGLASRK